MDFILLEEVIVEISSVSQKCLMTIKTRQHLRHL